MAESLLDRQIRRFAGADRQTRLEALLELSRKLPPLPERLQAASDREAHRIPECQTPVFLWVELVDGRLHLAADVPPESPTVRGFVSLLVDALHGADPAATRIPDDLLHRLGLEEALGMMRTQGLSALVRRLQRLIAEVSAG